MSENNRFSPAVLPPTATRTLQHPSLMALYMSAGLTRCRTQLDSDIVHVITPAEVFYLDPTADVDPTRGRRIPNTVCQFNVLDCFQLNTPPPIMSACPAPPARADPFRRGPHAIRDLGSRACRVPASLPPPAARANPHIVQLRPDEDEAITSLLRLHHQAPVHAGELWLEAELEAAHTLLRGFGPAEAEEEGPPSITVADEEEEEPKEPKEPSVPAKLSGSEEDAVNVLMTLWDTGAFGVEP